MIIRDIVKQNNLTLSDKGEECLLSAIKDVFPTLQTAPPEVVIRYLYVDLKTEDCLKVLHIAGRYAKLYVFS